MKQQKILHPTQETVRLSTRKKKGYEHLINVDTAYSNWVKQGNPLCNKVFHAVVNDIISHIRKKLLKGKNVKLSKGMGNLQVMTILTDFSKGVDRLPINRLATVKSGKIVREDKDERLLTIWRRDNGVSNANVYQFKPVRSLILEAYNKKDINNPFAIRTRKHGH